MASNPKNPVVFFDIQIGKRQLGRMVFELYADTNPKTAENFRSLCTGERGTSLSSRQKLHYQDSPFHRIISGFMAQGGDITRGDGTGGESIFGGKFPDENFTRTHDSAGLLSMANSGPNTNGSQFFITFRDTPHLDGRHVVFGKLIEGLELLPVMENVSTDGSDRPRAPVIIEQCGQIGEVLGEETAAAKQVAATNTAKSDTEKEQQTKGEASEQEEEQEEEEEEEQSEELIQQQLQGMSASQQRLFRLRLKINQGRKLNKAETEREYKQATDPGFAKRERAAERQARLDEEGGERQRAGVAPGQAHLMQTASECEQLQMKKAAKDRNRATFGWEAFTAEAGYKAYNKRLAKLPGASSTTSSSGSSSINALSYGKTGTAVTSNGLNRMVNEIEGQEEQREKHSRRRSHYEATTVDHINAKNEFFNKKIKRAFDKHTVEIRQNLERGTAL